MNTFSACSENNRSHPPLSPHAQQLPLHSQPDAAEKSEGDVSAKAGKSPSDTQSWLTQWSSGCSPRPLMASWVLPYLHLPTSLNTVTGIARPPVNRLRNPGSAKVMASEREDSTAPQYLRLNPRFFPPHYSGLCQGGKQDCCSVTAVSDFLRPHGLQHARLPCPPLSSRVCSNSCPSSR